MAKPHPWDVYEPLQAELRSTYMDSEYWGLEELANKVLDPATMKSSANADTRKRMRAAAARRERHRGHLRHLRVIQAVAAPIDADAECKALEVREAIEYIRAEVTADDWALLKAVAVGRSYAQLARERGVSSGSLRVRVSRLRAKLIKKAA